MSRPLTTCAGERIRTTQRTVSGDAWKRYDLAPAEQPTREHTSDGWKLVVLLIVLAMVYLLGDDFAKLIAAVLS